MDHVRNSVDTLEERKSYKQMPKDLEHIVEKLNRMNSINDRFSVIHNFTIMNIRILYVGFNFK